MKFEEPKTVEDAVEDIYQIVMAELDLPVKLSEREELLAKMVVAETVNVVLHGSKAIVESKGFDFKKMFSANAHI